MQAIREALAERPRPQSAKEDGLVFLTAQGRPWQKEDASSPLCFKVKALVRRLGINGRKGLGIYTLRHCFETVAGESRDQAAVDHVMGRSRDDMASVHREGISDERLRAVTDHVHSWLFPPEQKGKKAPERSE